MYSRLQKVGRDPEFGTTHQIFTRKWQNAGKNPNNYPHRLHANEVVLLVSIEATCRLVYVDAIPRLFSLSPLPFSQNAPPSQ